MRDPILPEVRDYDVIKHRWASEHEGRVASQTNTCKGSSGILPSRPQPPVPPTGSPGHPS
eukprot:gene28255-62184_t